MNLGTVVLGALAPTFGAAVRFRRFIPTERNDGGVNLSPERITGVVDDQKVVVYGISERVARELFGADVRATAAAVVATELAALLTETDQLKVMDGTLAGRCYQLVGRDISEAGQLGGAVVLGLSAAGQGAEGVWG